MENKKKLFYHLENQNFTTWKIIKYFGFSNDFSKNEEFNSKIKLSNNSCFVILILAILKFRNIVISNIYITITYYINFEYLKRNVGKIDFFIVFYIIVQHVKNIFRVGIKIGTTKCRTTGISKFWNCEY